MFKKPEFIFLIFGFVFGLMMLFITPINGVPDEPAHFWRAQEVSKGNFYNNFPEKRNDNYQFHGASGYSPVMYAFSGISLKLTQKMDFKIQYHTGRFVNLIVWLILIALAIHITPVFKWAFFAVALLPMSIYEGMSFSADSFSNAFAFLFFAYIFKLIFNNKEFSNKKDIPLLFVCTIIGALCKGIIFPIFLLPLVPIKKHKLLICTLFILLGISISYLWSSNNYIALMPNVNYELNKNLILTHPINHLLFILKTYILRSPNLLGQFLARLGWLNISLHKLAYILMLFTLICSVVLIPEKHQIKLKHKLFAAGIFIIYVISMSSLMFCMCNRVGDPFVMGLQGRYFLSVSPLLFYFLLLLYTCFVLYSTLLQGELYFFPHN